MLAVVIDDLGDRYRATTRTTALGRLPATTSGCFVDAKPEEPGPDRRTALEKFERQLRVGFDRPLERKQ